jgi:predicted dehydrogenase
VDNPVTKALVVGAGSIGARHAAVLAELGFDVATVSARDDLDWPTFGSLPEALGRFDPSYVVIANQTSLHARAVAELAELGFHGILLVEKPLAMTADAATGLPFERVGVGYNLRFHPVIARLRELLAGIEVFTVEAYAGQHLETWRPGRSARSQYSAVKSMGGGVLRDLSHELDYLGLLLGDCLGVFARGGRLSTVTEDSDDAWGIVAGYQSAPLVTLQLNYLDTHTRRRLVLNTSIGTIEADLVAASVRVGADTETFATERNQTYRAMHEAMRAPGSPVATLAEALATERTIAAIEQSAAEQRWIEQDGNDR